MAVKGYGIILNKTCDLGLYSSTSTYETGSNTIYTVSGTHGSGYVSLRATVDGMLSGKTFVIRNIQIQLKKSGSFSESANISIGSCNASSSGFQSFSSSKSYPKGSTVLLSQISTNWTTVIIVSDGNSTIDSYWKDKSASVSIYPVFNYDTGSAQSSNTINLSFNAPKIERTLKYIKDTGSQYSSVTQAYGSTTTIINGYSKPGYTDTSSGNFTITFDSRGGSNVDSKSLPWSWRQPITYTFSDWGGYKPGSTYTFLSDKELKASFIIGSGDRVWTYPTLGGLQYTTRKGYQKTNVWYYSDDNVQAQTTDKITKSRTLYATWQPWPYKISYNLNGGKLLDSSDRISNYTTEKVYGINSVKTPPFRPLKLGYEFGGWTDSTGIARPINEDNYLNDDVFDLENTDTSHKDVILYAKWNLKPNTVKCVYYAPNDNTYREDTETYTIETKTLDPDNDFAYLKYSPIYKRGDDFVFLGWCDTKPDGWDDTSRINNGYHGTYVVTPEIVVDAQGHKIVIESPIDLKIKNYKNLDDWGTTDYYYGIWAKTGKYIKVNNQWEKVSRAYVKIDGEWKIITDVWTKQSNSWKHEI